MAVTLTDEDIALVAARVQALSRNGRDALIAAGIKQGVKERKNDGSRVNPEDAQVVNRESVSEVKPGEAKGEQKLASRKDKTS